MFNLKEELKVKGINITDDMINKFDQYFKMLTEYNEHTNITRITDKDDVYALHFYDSLMTSLAFNDTNKKLLDIGAGAGFPSLPLKIVFDDLDVTMVDSVNKKVIFLDGVINELKLNNIRAIHERIENLKEYNSYDYVVARALSSLKEIIKYSHKYIKDDGEIIALKGMKKSSEEIEEAKDVLKKYKLKVDSIIPYNVLDRNYCLIVIKRDIKWMKI